MHSLIHKKGLQEQKIQKGRLHPVPRFGADLAAARKPRRQLQDGDDRRDIAGRHQLRRNAEHAEVSWIS